jgi:protein-disulfide isomerase
MGNTDHLCLVSALVLSSLLFCSSPLRAQQSSIDEKLNQILVELRQVRQLLDDRSEQPLAQGETVAVDVGEAPLLGSEGAPVTIVEFVDYRCGYCRQFHEQTFGALKRLYIDTGRARLYVMSFPRANRPGAVRAARAARCVREAGGDFWAVHERMLLDTDQLEAEDLAGFATDLNIDAGGFRSCLQSGRYNEEILLATQDAVRLGVQGTPTFVVGISTEDGVEGEWVVGAMPLGVFQAKIEMYDREGGRGSIK